MHRERVFHRIHSRCIERGNGGRLRVGRAPGRFPTGVIGRIGFPFQYARQERSRFKFGVDSSGN